MLRDNDTWLLQLSRQGAEQQTALADLRAVLLRGLRRPMSAWSIVDDSFLEDVVQDTLILVLERMHQFEGRSQFTTWATTIAIRVAMSKLRRVRWREISVEELIASSDFKLEQAVSEDSGPEIQFEQKVLLEKLYTVIQNDLSRKQKTALIAELKGMPIDEIARHLGSNRNAVYKLTHDARKKLKQALQIAGYSLADVNAAFTL